MSIIENMVVHIEIDISETGHADTWWSLPAEMSADIMEEYEDKVAQVNCLLAQKGRKKRQKRDQIEISKQLCQDDDMKEDEKGNPGGGDDSKLPVMVIDSEEDEEDEKDEKELVTVQFEWEWPKWKKGTKIVDGQATNLSAYTLNFDTMMQKNNDTGFVRKFRVVNVLLPVDVTTSDEESFEASIRVAQFADNLRRRQSA